MFTTGVQNHIDIIDSITAAVASGDCIYATENPLALC